ncbi:MAG: glycosyltransferase family 2 protein [archaeon]
MTENAISDFVSVIIPAYNEEDSISETVRRVSLVLKENKIAGEIIVVDDGSTDKTSSKIAGIKGLRLIAHPTNRGYGAALKTGLRSAIGKWIFITDADGTYPVEDFSRLWEKREKADMVVGARNPSSQHIAWTRKPGKMFLSLIANYLVGQKIPDLNSGMRLFRKDMGMEFYHLYPQGFSFTITITLASLVNRYTVKYVPIDYAPRKGKSKMNVIKDGLNFISLIFRVITYFNPGKIFMPIGTLFILLGFFVAYYSTYHVGRFMDATTVLLLLAGIQVYLFAFIAQLWVKTRAMR